MTTATAGAADPDHVHPDHADPYAAYLSWIAEGRPSMTGASALRPVEGTVLLTDHVRVQLQALDSELLSLGSTPRRSMWARLTERFRRPAA